jgi:hypothetical protein
VKLALNTRRHVLQLLATAPVAVSAGCSGGDLPDPVAAWRDPGAGETDPRRFALAHAILAPNPHNMQPWLVDLVGEDEMALYCDLDRRLPATDPFDRQITIGCGAFGYLYSSAIESLGLGQGSTFQWFPEGAPEPGARLDERPILRFVTGTGPYIDCCQNFFDQVTARRTNRNPYDATPPDAAALQRVAAAARETMQDRPDSFVVSAHVEADPARVARIRDIVWRAWEMELNTPAAWEESVNVMRIGKREIAEHRDGLSIDGPMIPFAKAIGMMSRAHMLDPNSGANDQGRQQWRAMIESAPAFIWLTTRDDMPVTRVIAGMAYARANLAATGDDLAMHPWSQALQEYPEMEDLYAEMRAELGVGEGETLQMLARIGRAEACPPSPRRGLDAVLRA